jgi:hypothetical protein
LKLSLGLAALAVLVAGCGDSEKTHATARPIPASERAAAAARVKRELPRYSAPSIVARLTSLPPAERRHALITDLRRSVRADARARLARHELRGPILDVSCEVTRDDEDYARAHPAAAVLRYDCLAINFRAKTVPPMQLGSQFQARVDFAHSKYAWCLFTPVGGEGTHSATTLQVRPAPACVAPPTG